MDNSPVRLTQAERDQAHDRLDTVSAIAAGIAMQTAALNDRIAHAIPMQDSEFADLWARACRLRDAVDGCRVLVPTATVRARK